MAAFRIDEESMMASKYQFYEIVRVSEQCVREQVAGLEGVILGMAQDEQGRWSYAVHLYELGESWHLFEDELEPTGRMSSREEFYDGTHITVVVDPETGEGRITGYYR
jgi:hypothetical protein